MVQEQEQTEKTPQTPKVTRAEKAKRQKAIVRLLLKTKDYKWNDLLEAATKKYLEKHSDEEPDVADLKGKIGSSFSLMEEDGEVAFDKKTSICSLVKKDKKQMKKKEETKEELKGEVPMAESTPKKRGRKKKEEAPAATEEVKEPAAETPAPEQAEKKTAEKKPARAKTPAKKAEKTEKTEKTEAVEKTETVEKTEVSAKAEKAEPPQKTEEPVKAEVKEEKLAPVFDMTAFLGNKTSEKKAEKPTEKPAEKEEKKAVLTEFAFLGNAGIKARADAPQKAEPKEERKEPAPTPAPKKEEKREPAPAPQKEEKREPAPAPAPQKEEKTQKTEPRRDNKNGVKRQTRIERAATLYSKLTEEEKLKVDFLKRLRTLGGEYFEYYSVYLLERYSLKNGRRLEALRVSGGDRDGGIDGELELTDKFGFRETLYIQSKNWDDSKGDAEKWTVGETLLQQFVGAVACRQAKEGKRKCRGIFVTTSHFTEGAKEILDSMSADFIGYDGDEVFETAKECQFGLVQKDGKWQLDEKLLAGEKAFFDLL